MQPANRSRARLIRAAVSQARWLLALALGTLFPALAHTGVERVVIIKVDGLPASLVQRELPRLPNIKRIFDQNGTTLDNFYVRGLSLSAPSWSLLDTGRHLEIHGNVEYDRYTLRAYDYLNFVPFYVGYAVGRSVDMPAVRILDETRTPLLLDRFPYEERFQGMELYQRGARFDSLGSSLTRAISAKPKELLDEWETGFSMADSISRQTEHDLLEALKDPKIKYLNLFVGDYDHTAHLTNDRVLQLRVLQEIDALAGRIWAGINQSPLASRTMLVLVSDHGMNNTAGVISQGFSLVDWFTGPGGGAQHVLTNRYPLGEFKLRSLDPFVNEVINPSKESPYLQGQSSLYPTVMLDPDGNERACIGFRNNTLNQLHVLLDQLTRNKLPGPLRTAAISAFFAIRRQVEAEWGQEIEALREDLAGLDRRIAQQQIRVDALPKKWTQIQKDLGLDKIARREAIELETWKSNREAYSNYAKAITRLLDLEPGDFEPGKLNVESVIPSKSFGPLNTLYDLQNYVTGPAESGLVLGANGSLDLDRSFRRLDLFSEFDQIRMRNNVQPGVASRPVDFTAARVRLDGSGAIWVREDDDHQALIFARSTFGGAIELRYLPVSHLQAVPNGDVHFISEPWAPGFPLHLFEDPQLSVPADGDRAAWLSEWHTDREWLEATHRCEYSNAIVGLAEELLDLGPNPVADSRYLTRRRTLRRTDMLVLANNHWNFNFRGFNPGGNHGSFFRISTHSTLMFAGGTSTGIPRGEHVATPYDSLSFVPTILSLMNRPEPDLPGPLIRELVNPGP
jgi:hypothetical protein